VLEEYASRVMEILIMFFQQGDGYQFHRDVTDSGVDSVVEVTKQRGLMRLAVAGIAIQWEVTGRVAVVKRAATPSHNPRVPPTTFHRAPLRLTPPQFSFARHCSSMRYSTGHRAI
jgi:hypothetical protein